MAFSATKTDVVRSPIGTQPLLLLSWISLIPLSGYNMMFCLCKLTFCETAAFRSTVNAGIAAGRIPITGMLPAIIFLRFCIDSGMLIRMQIVDFTAQHNADIVGDYIHSKLIKTGNFQESFDKLKIFDTL